MNRCATKFCRGKASESGRSPYCAKCRTRRFKAAFPLKYSFNLLRNRARHRGHDFSLTFAEYEAFAIKTRYGRLKGKTALSLSIDRENPARGYHADNIRAVTLAENTRLKYAPLPDYVRAEMEKAEVPEQPF